MKKSNPKIRQWRPSDIPDLSGKVYVITGANSGLGFETTKELAVKGATIYMLCRNKDKAQDAIDAIKKGGAPHTDLRFIQMDLSSLASIKEASERILKEVKTISALVNNAGIMMLPERVNTKDGFETQMGVNHLGHFALTQALFGALDPEDGRVVVLSSIGHKFNPKGLNLNNLNSENYYQSIYTYCQSKLANAVFGKALSERVNDSGKNIKVITVHPGYARTNLQSTGPSGFLNRLFSISNNVLAQSANKGAWPVMMAATTNLMQNGGYYGPMWFDTFGPDGACRFSKHVKNNELQDALWDKSEQLTRLTFTV